MGRLFGALFSAAGVALSLSSCGYRINSEPRQNSGSRAPFPFQSKINSLPCQNTFRPQGRAAAISAVRTGSSTLEVVSADVYVELQDSAGRTLRSAAGRMSANPVSGEFSAVVLCSAALVPDDRAYWGIAVFPEMFGRAENLIRSNIGVIFPTVGQDMNWTHPAYSQRFTPTEYSISTWLELSATEGQIEVYDNGYEIEVMASQLFSPMQDQTRWLQFYLARYRVAPQTL